jgi:hypothetical protein
MRKQIFIIMAALAFQGCASKMSYPEGAQTQGASQSFISVIGAPRGAMVQIDNGQAQPLFDQNGRMKPLPVVAGLRKVQVSAGQRTLYVGNVLVAAGGTAQIAIAP